MDLFKAMRTFVLVAEKQSFSAASRELNLVTSAVSKQVADLETHFSTQLLYRTTRTMHLTNEGEYYIEQFKDIIARIDDLEDIANQRQQKIAGHLHISAPQGSASLGFLQSASDFLKHYPNVRISWMFMNRFANMAEEGIDLSIRVGELPDSNLIARRYSAISVYFVASPEYIHKHGLPEHPKELLQHQCILDSSNRLPGRWRYMENGVEEHVAVDSFLAVNDGEIAAKFVADGHGIAQLPTFLMQSYLDSGQLLPILTDFEFAAAPVSLVFPANKLINPTLRTFIDYLVDNKPS